jgi:hypothetical protein
MPHKVAPLVVRAPLNARQGDSPSDPDGIPPLPFRACGYSDEEVAAHRQKVLDNRQRLADEKRAQRDANAMIDASRGRAGTAEIGNVASTRERVPRARRLDVRRAGATRRFDVPGARRANTKRISTAPGSSTIKE